MLDLKKPSSGRWLRLLAWLIGIPALIWLELAVAGAGLPTTAAMIAGGLLGLWVAVGFRWALMPLLRDAGYAPDPRAEPTWRGVAWTAFFFAVSTSLAKQGVDTIILGAPWSWSSVGYWFGLMGLLFSVSLSVGLALRKLVLRLRARWK
ncbi:MAG: hypothetical protein ACYC8T_14975 [Myxococcaceae bacterium]